MSNRWPGGIVRKTPVTPTGPLQNGAASGVWSLADAAYWTKQGLWPLAGNILAIEDVFSTYLYTGTSAAQTITNGIDLAGKGGLVWLKNRGSALSHILIDTVQGCTFAGGKSLISNSTNGAGTIAANTFQFDSTGFSFGSAAAGGAINGSGQTYASWTFREAPNFFDVVTYTGDGTSGRAIPHNLGIAPGCIIIKRTDASQDWAVAHRGNGTTGANAMSLNDAVGSSYTTFPVTNTTFTVSTSGTNGIYNSFGQGMNTNGATYVAYLYAHDTSANGLIQCGSYTGNGNATGPTVTLGWEPQWLMVKNTSATSNWQIIDNMRGMPVGSADATLQANLANAESAVEYVSPTATGFQVTSTSSQVNTNTQTYIYIAIRRGPMKTPTLGTSVFLPLATSSAVDTAITTNFPVDLMISGQRNSNNATDNWAFIDRLRGATASTNTDGSSQKRLLSTSTNAETNPTYPYAYNWWNTGMVQGYGLAGASQIYYTLRRAPGFFDEVCYTGTGVLGRTVTHNLGVVPEMMIFKRRSASNDWGVYHSALGNTKLIYLNYNLAPYTSNNWWNATTPTASVFTVGDQNENNTNGSTYVGYLFASCPGVSKVGSYTGTGALQTVNCAFTTGARFVLIKRTDTTGDWYVWDSARGISSGTDPYLLLNDVSAETTGTNYVDTDTTGFKVTAAAPAGINANGGTYIFLAIA
jgi:hypothetical protein